MPDTELTQNEIEALKHLRTVVGPAPVPDQDAGRLLSLTLIEQKEGGYTLTDSGADLLRQIELQQELDAQLEQTFPASDPPKLTRPH